MLLRNFQFVPVDLISSIPSVDTIICDLSSALKQGMSMLGLSWMEKPAIMINKETNIDCLWMAYLSNPWQDLEGK